MMYIWGNSCMSTAETQPKKDHFISRTLSYPFISRPSLKTNSLLTSVKQFQKGRCLHPVKASVGYKLAFLCSGYKEFISRYKTLNVYISVVKRTNFRPVIIFQLGCSMPFMKFANRTPLICVNVASCVLCF